MLTEWVKIIYSSLMKIDFLEWKGRIINPVGRETFLDAIASLDLGYESK